MIKVCKRKGGFSLSEVIVALAMIVIVSITALSIVFSSIVSRATAVNKIEAQNFADNVWECFKVSEYTGDFVSNVYFSEGVALTGRVTDENGYRVYTYNSDEYNFTADIRVRFDDVVRPDFVITVTDNNGNSIISFSYRKGGDT